MNNKVRWEAVVGIATVVGAIAAVLALVLPPGSLFGGSDSSTTTSPSKSSPRSKSDPSLPSSSESFRPPLPPTASLADVVVMQHCVCEGPRGQGQIKLKVRVTNRSDVPLNAAIGNLRLLVPGTAMPEPWTPNEPAADPSTVMIDGSNYVAIPANGNKAWEQQYATFASFWWAGTLNPGDVYAGQGKDNGDLVFYVPAGPDQTIKLGGVALVTNDGRTVLGWQSSDHWGPETDPSTF